MSVVDFEVTTPYGQVAGYPLNNGFHRGIDYGCPTGTPVVVNGVTIGISGATGYVTGPHCHIGKWNGGTVLDPGVGNGLSFNSAKVSDIGEDDTNGKYVKVFGDGYTWVYLHLSNNKLVSVGQVLEGGGDMHNLTDAEYQDLVNWKNWGVTCQNIFGATGTWKDIGGDLGNLEAYLNDLIAWKKQGIGYQNENADLKKQLAAQGTVLKPGKYTVQ